MAGREGVVESWVVLLTYMLLKWTSSCALSTMMSMASAATTQHTQPAKPVSLLMAD